MRNGMLAWWNRRGLVGRAWTFIIATGFVMGLALTLLALVGALNTEGPHLDWNVVGALAAVVGAFFTVVGATAIGQAAKRFEEDARTTRISRQPYIRADIAFADRHEANFTPPNVEHMHSLEELGLYGAAEDLRDIDSSDTWSSFDLVLWLTNLQLEPLGIADQITLAIRLNWRNAKAIDRDQLVEIEVAYLGPGEVIAIRLCRPPKTVRRFAAHVLDIGYRDIFDGSCFDCHGAMRMLYDGTEVKNERQVRRKFKPKMDRHARIHWNLRDGARNRRGGSGSGEAGNGRPVREDGER